MYQAIFSYFERQDVVSTKEFLEIVEKANKWRHDINYKEYPLKYVVTNDCGGMYICEPYKDDLLQSWKFSTTSAARKSAELIKGMFFKYLACEDFVGADLAKKYLRAGHIRQSIPGASREFFRSAYNEIEDSEKYATLKTAFVEIKKTGASEK